MRIQYFRRNDITFFNNVFNQYLTFFVLLSVFPFSKMWGKRLEQLALLKGGCENDLFLSLFSLYL